MNMNLNFSIEELVETGKAFACIFVGSLTGIVTYMLFLHFNIAIFGWNFGLIVAPIVAGYVETYLALKLLNKSIGAISAFVLFIITVVYGFLLKNPTLGPNLMTAGISLIIIQSAVPILINYILLVVIVGIISYFLGIFEKITKPCYSQLKKVYYEKILKKPLTVTKTPKIIYDDIKECINLNSRNFYFFTTNEPLNGKIEKYLGLFVGKSSFEKRTKIISSNYKQEEDDLLKKFKIAKIEALNNLVDSIKKSDGNGVVELKIEYELIDLSKGRFQILAHGTGIKLKE